MIDIEGWLGRYGEAWEQADPDAAAALFTADAVYHWGPFRPLEGPEAIRDRWSIATADDDQVRFTWDLLGRDGDRVFVHWNTVITSPGADADEMDGAFVLDFVQDGRCSQLQEWWLTRPAS